MHSPHLWAPVVETYGKEGLGGYGSRHRRQGLSLASHCPATRVGQAGREHLVGVEPGRHFVLVLLRP